MTKMFDVQMKIEFDQIGNLRKNFFAKIFENFFAKIFFFSRIGMKLDIITSMKTIKTFLPFEGKSNTIGYHGEVWENSRIFTSAVFNF